MGMAKCGTAAVMRYTDFANSTNLTTFVKVVRLA